MISVVSFYLEQGIFDTSPLSSIIQFFRAFKEEKQLSPYSFSFSFIYKNESVVPGNQFHVMQRHYVKRASQETIRRRLYFLFFCPFFFFLGVLPAAELGNEDEEAEEEEEEEAVEDSEDGCEKDSNKESMGDDEEVVVVVEAAEVLVKAKAEKSRLLLKFPNVSDDKEESVKESLEKSKEEGLEFGSKPKPSPFDEESGGKKLLNQSSAVKLFNTASSLDVTFTALIYFLLDKIARTRFLISSFITSGLE